jgi:surfactin synthase thioesterase subunit
MNLLGAGSAGKLTDEQKRSAHIILYGHSWGASAAVALARSLQKDGIPVLLTVQVDSIAKSGQNDAVIPDNVRYAANFYQDKGFLRGQQQIQAADASRTQILGNFRMDYTENPISCPQYPWYTRVFMRSHIEIECDQQVWRRVEGLIREKLPTSVADSARTGRP